MRVVNETSWNSKQLKTLFAVCLKEVRRREGNRAELRKQTVRVKTHRNRSWIGGRAGYHTNYLTMKIPVVQFEATTVSDKKTLDFVQCIADTYMHEVGHNLGVRHHRVVGYPVVCTIEHMYRDWILANVSNALYPLAKAVPMQKQQDLQVKRYNSVQLNLKRAASRLKRARTIFTKWQRKAKYYELVMANKRGG